MPLKIAFAGTGYISRIHARAAEQIPDLELTAVVNHRPQSRADFAQEFHIPRQYTTVEELIQAGDVTVLSINTPNYLHAPQAIAALEAGIHVLVEKPMAMNVTESTAMIKAGQESGALLMVAHCWRFDEEVLWLKDQLADGRIGPIIRTKGYGVHVHWGPSGWFTKEVFAGGGALADMGIHAIDTARFLLDDPEPASVYACLGTHYKPLSDAYDVDDTGLIVIRWANETVSYIESGWWQPHADGPEASTQLYGAGGLAQLFPTRLALPTVVAKEVAFIESGFPPTREPHCPQSMYDAQMAYFIDCIRGNSSPTPGGLEGLTNMRIIAAAYESARTGQVVFL